MIETTISDKKSLSADRVAPARLGWQGEITALAFDEAAVRQHAQQVIAELGVTDMKGFGPVMKRMSADLRGRADGQLVNRVVRDLLTPSA